ncbi:hypothetical protein Ndes2526B_g01278 [Nannochloris sp. 'desiccata']|nr:hypothetical protein KSW81_004385 [Chlorella desiccata (nom. nud.)]KAH7624025.1 putative ER membrane protein complex subunit 7-like protein [Chlorella desiccata (nom. nud.)]
MSKLIAIVILAAVWPSVSANAASGNSRSVAGNLILPEGMHLPADVVVALRGIDGNRVTTFARPDGTFNFHTVADGIYYVEVEALGYQFLSMKVVVKGTDIQISSPDVPNAGKDLPYPLRIPVLSMVQYFEQRQGFNVMSFIKTPYGMMIAFMVFSLLIMPMLKVDPEEYQEMMEEKKKLTSALTGGGTRKEK